MVVDSKLPAPAVEGDNAESPFERVRREIKEAWHAADGDPAWIKVAEEEWIAARIEEHKTRLRQEGRTTATESAVSAD